MREKKKKIKKFLENNNKKTSKAPKQINNKKTNQPKRMTKNHHPPPQKKHFKKTKTTKTKLELLSQGGYDFFKISGEYDLQNLTRLQSLAWKIGTVLAPKVPSTLWSVCFVYPLETF